MAITEVIITSTLSRLSNLFVISRSPLLPTKAKPVKVKDD